MGKHMENPSHSPDYMPKYTGIRKQFKRNPSVS
jgi:hypothetical protein